MGGSLKNIAVPEACQPPVLKSNGDCRIKGPMQPYAEKTTGRCCKRIAKMGSRQGKWSPERRPRTFTMIGAELLATRSSVTKPEMQDASTQAEGSPAPMETTQAGQLAGDPTGEVGQEAPPDTPQDTGGQFFGQVMQEQPFDSQGSTSDNEMLPLAEGGGEAMSEMIDEGDPHVFQETTAGHHVAQIPPECEMMDNEKNAQLEAQMEELP
uniref:Uncharacterized protein n=1 Tax=Sphaerodactylus townsendi TaxID=933632 RepID=A0ACB8EXM2_9SAUR